MLLFSNNRTTSNEDLWFSPCHYVEDKECFAYAISPSIGFGILVVLSVFMMLIMSGAPYKVPDASYKNGAKLVNGCTVILLLSIILPPIYGTISDDIENPYSVYVISSVLDLLLVIVSWLVHNEMCAYYGMNVPRSRALFMILIHLLVVAVFFIQGHDSLDVYDKSDDYSDKFYIIATGIRSLVGILYFMICLAHLLKSSSTSTASDGFVPLMDPSRVQNNSTDYAPLDDSSTKEEEEEGEKETSSLSPESRSGWWSRISFSWMNDLMKIGASRTLEDQDLYPLLSKDKTDLTSSKLEKAWKEEEKSDSPSLSRAIRKALGLEFIMAGLIKFVYVVMFERG